MIEALIGAGAAVAAYRAAIPMVAKMADGKIKDAMQRMLGSGGTKPVIR